jgi:hypothetical protein
LRVVDDPKIHVNLGHVGVALLRRHQTESAACVGSDGLAWTEACAAVINLDGLKGATWSGRLRYGSIGPA